MPARTGAQYIQGLKERNLEVWIDGQRITDVTTFPGFRRGIGTMAALYDMQHDPETSEEMTYVSPTSGDRVGLSYLTPKEQGDLERRSCMVRHWAMGSAGMMGRTPDYVNVSLMAMAAAEGYFAQGRPELARNMRNYFEHIRENDLVLTHSLDNFQRNRSPLPEHRALFEERMLHVRKETDAGLIVRGCRRLATLGPISDEVAVYPIAPQQRTEHPERHALAFAIPNDTPGLKFVCRESFDYGRSHFDHPLGSRFEEMDATVFFHDVLIPWERVFLYGDVDQCDRLTRDTSFLAHGDHQAVMRQIVKSEFLLGLASLMTQTLGNDDQPHVQERLGELIMYLEVMKGGLRAAEVEAKVDQWGVLTPSYDKLASVRTLYARIFNPRMVEVIQLLGSSSLMALPSQADFGSALRPALDRYMATDTAKAIDRARLFHLAWDVSCSAFGARQMHYERHFAGNPVGGAQVVNASYNKEPAKEFVREFMGWD